MVRASIKRGGRRSSRRRSGSRKLNAYFKAMLHAKKSRASSFMYKGKRYVGRAHPRLGMIYKRG